VAVEDRDGGFGMSVTMKNALLPQSAVEDILRAAILDSNNPKRQISLHRFFDISTGGEAAVITVYNDSGILTRIPLNPSGWATLRALDRRGVVDYFIGVCPDYFTPKPKPAWDAQRLVDLEALGVRRIDLTQEAGEELVESMKGFYEPGSAMYPPGCLGKFRTLWVYKARA
jgi:hypothetical protein